MPQLSTDVGTAVEQLITLLTQQKHALETQAQQIEHLQVQHNGFFDDRQIRTLMDRVSKSEVFMRKVNDRVDTLEKNETSFDDELKESQALWVELDTDTQDVKDSVAKLNADLVLFWRMTFLERLAWLLGGARLFGRMAKIITWWRKRWLR